MNQLSQGYRLILLFAVVVATLQTISYLMFKVGYHSQVLLAGEAVVAGQDDGFDLPIDIQSELDRNPAIYFVDQFEIPPAVTDYPIENTD